MSDFFTCDRKVTYTVESGELPFGLTLNKETGVISSWIHEVMSQPFFGDKL